MFTYISVILAIAAIFMALMVQLAAEPRISAKLTGGALVLSALGGFFFYGFGYAFLESDATAAVLRGLLSVCDMFTGGVEYEVVSDTPLDGYPWLHVLFWFVHLTALYATASAAVAALGSEALKKLRLWASRKHNLCIIYGVNSDTIDFANELMAKTRDLVLFVDPQPEPGCAETITQSGCVLRTDENALKANLNFAKGIGIRPGKRSVTLYALGGDGDANLRYAEALRDTLEQRGMEPRQISLIILGVADAAAARLQISEKDYGYGFVTVFREADLVSRLLIQNYPPCDTLEFDAQGVAKENFEALLIGFGRFGQSVLRSLVMNGQFVGSSFRCDVFDPQCDQRMGFLGATCKTLMSDYDIRLYPQDGRSRELFALLEERGEQLKYIVVCTNDVRLNREIAEDILQFLEKTGSSLPVYQCSRRGVVRCGNDTTQVQEARIYSPDLLRYDRIDRLAMGINKTYYYDNPKTALELWMECDHFSRMSSRASADFFPAILRAAGTDVETVLEQGWKPEGQLLETLGKMEHIRWNAFHFTMGYNPMSREEYDLRAAGYRQDLQNGKKPRRIGKNTAARTHACLISWEELDALSARENSITGGDVDYKEMDRRNVLAIRDILRDNA